MSWFRRRRRQPELQPEAPQNVRLARTDGTEIPCEMIYKGKRGDIHVWANAYPVAFSIRDHLVCDVLPAHTEIVLSMPFTEVT